MIIRARHVTTTTSRGGRKDAAARHGDTRTRLREIDSVLDRETSDDVIVVVTNDYCLPSRFRRVPWTSRS